MSLIIARLLITLDKHLRHLIDDFDGNTHLILIDIDISHICLQMLMPRKRLNDSSVNAFIG